MLVKDRITLAAVKEAALERRGAQGGCSNSPRVERAEFGS